jgi:hypothetical protein
MRGDEAGEGRRERGEGRGERGEEKRNVQSASRRIRYFNFPTLRNLRFPFSPLPSPLSRFSR